MHSNTALLLLTPWIVVILEKLIVTWLAEKCLTFYETQKIQFGVHKSPQYFLSLPLLNDGSVKGTLCKLKGKEIWAFNVLIGKCNVKKPLIKARWNVKDSINMDIREMHYKGVNWTEVVQKEKQ